MVGRRFVYLATTDSTNDVARDLAERGEPEGTAVFADEQTRGRGRVGKSAWLTPANTSIALSVVLRPPLEPAALAALSMLAAVAVVDAIKAETTLVASLKWPNDVLISGRKVAGILVASALDGTRVRYAVVGIGINGNFRAGSLGPLPDAALTPTTLFDECGRPVCRERLLAWLLDDLDDGYRLLRTGGVMPILSQYTDRLGTLGQTVQVLALEGAVEGVAEDVAPDGALVVRLPDGTRRTFSYGEVTVRGAPHSAPHSGG